MKSADFSVLVLRENLLNGMIHLHTLMSFQTSTQKERFWSASRSFPCKYNKYGLKYSSFKKHANAPKIWSIQLVPDIPSPFSGVTQRFVNQLDHRMMWLKVMLFLCESSGSVKTQTRHCCDYPSQWVEIEKLLIPMWMNHLNRFCKSTRFTKKIGPKRMIHSQFGHCYMCLTMTDYLCHVCSYCNTASEVLYQYQGQ